MPLRVIFMGTPELSCASLQALIEAPGLQVDAVVTQPDRPKGRDLKLRPSPVKELALRENLPVMQPERVRNEDFIQALQDLKPELIAVAAYGQLLPKSILDLPRFGCVNVHTSLLPRYRGAAPIQWSIINGDTETGVTIMKMDAGMDTGGILAQEKTPIHPHDNAETLHDRLAKIGAALLIRTIPDYVAATIVPQPQPAAGVSYAPKLKRLDGQIDWNQPAQAIANRIRGLAPWPGAFSYLPANPQHGAPISVMGVPATSGHLPGNPQALMLKIWQAEVTEQPGNSGEILRADKTGLLVACGHDALLIQALQLEGGRRLTTQEFLAGHRLQLGQRLG